MLRAEAALSTVSTKSLSASSVPASRLAEPQERLSADAAVPERICREPMSYPLGQPPDGALDGATQSGSRPAPEMKCEARTDPVRQGRPTNISSRCVTIRPMVLHANRRLSRLPSAGPPSIFMERSQAYGHRITAARTCANLPRGQSGHFTSPQSPFKQLTHVPFRVGWSRPDGKPPAHLPRF